MRNKVPDPKCTDWHSSRNPFEPSCSAEQWRTRDRNIVMYFNEMTDSHLRYSIQFARTRPQHKSRLSGLLLEQRRRLELSPNAAPGYF